MIPRRAAGDADRHHAEAGRMPTVEREPPHEAAERDAGGIADQGRP
jgi:hypothetical protein